MLKTDPLLLLLLLLPINGLGCVTSVLSPGFQQHLAIFSPTFKKSLRSSLVGDVIETKTSHEVICVGHRSSVAWQPISVSQSSNEERVVIYRICCTFLIKALGSSCSAAVIVLYVFVDMNINKFIIHFMK